MGRGYKSIKRVPEEGIRTKKPTYDSRPTAAPGEFDRNNGRVSKINSYKDIADEVDDFHTQRDSVLLDGGVTATGKYAKRAEDDDSEGLSDQEEVYGLDNSDDDDEEDDEEDDEDGEGASDSDSDGPDDDEEATGPKKSSRKLTTASDSEDENASDSEDGIEGWGTAKSAYYAGRDTNEFEAATEQDELAEQAEALRIQAKQLSGMSASDFLPDFDEDDDEPTAKGSTTTLLSKTTKRGQTSTVTEALPTVIPANLSPEEKIKLLKLRNPEFEPLSREFTSLQKVYAEFINTPPTEALEQAKFKALSAYLGVLAMYFALLSADSETAWVAVKEHNVMQGLIKCRQLWEKVKELKSEGEKSKALAIRVSGDDEDMMDVDSELGELSNEEDYESVEEGESEGEDVEDDSEAEEEDDEDEDELEELTPPPQPLPTRKRIKLSSTDTSRSARLARTEASLSSLTNLLNTTTAPKPARKASSTQPTTTNDFADPTSLTSSEAHAKSVRKNSLRFHTAQLISKSAKRAQSARDAGGDIDIPHRERIKERMDRLAREAEARNLKNPGGKGGDGVDLDGSEWTERDVRDAAAVNTDRKGGDGVLTTTKSTTEDPDLAYYNLVANASLDHKAQKAAAHSAIVEATKAGNIVRIEKAAGALGADGKRAIGYTIEKNKGLTPHRKKDVRNPRVKKRKKYEAAQIKLRSKKATYKPLAGAYGGEATGIKTNLVKSVKLK
ncbi:Sas10 C-terminal domain-containing protein [Peziza echinospora]|nr:Sas10 C-terminal domain-containing protein [Peziza echinospora]